MCALSGFAATCPAVESPIINKCLQLFPDIFASSSQLVGLCNIRPFRIETTSPPICQPAYRTPLTKRMVPKTLANIIQAYVWPGVWRDIVTFIKKCSVCQIYAKQKDHVEIGDMPISAYPMQIIGVDLIGPFVESTRGNKYALTIVDHCSGWGEAIPILNKRAETVLNAFHNEFIPRHGVPHILISDSGTEFTSLEWTNYMENLKIDH